MKFIFIILLIFVGCNEDPVSTPPDDNSIVGTWQAIHFRDYDDVECQVLGWESEGPVFNLHIDDNVCNGEEECGGECLLESESGVLAELYMHFDDSGTYYEWSELILDNYVYIWTEDEECDDELETCVYVLVNEIEHEIEVGLYEIQDNSILTQQISEFEFETGTINRCEGEGCLEGAGCNNYIQENCFNDGYYDQDNTQEDGSIIIDLLTNDRLIIREINLEWNECEILEFIRIDSYEMGGCMNPDVFNYNPAATFDDGSCGNSQCTQY